jgi:hypothetical protein
MRKSVEPPIPERLEAHSFNIAADEYVLLSFPVGAEFLPFDVSIA